MWSKRTLSRIAPSQHHGFATVMWAVCVVLLRSLDKSIEYDYDYNQNCFVSAPLPEWAAWKDEVPRLKIAIRSVGKNNDARGNCNEYSYKRVMHSGPEEEYRRFAGDLKPDLLIAALLRDATWTVHFLINLSNLNPDKTISIDWDDIFSSNQ